MNCSKTGKKDNLTYIFNGHPISNIGGAQIYIKNKIKYLKRKGYNVHVFHYSSKNSEIVIDELKEFTPSYFPQLKYKYYLFKKKFIDKTLNSLEDLIINKSNVIIESNDLNSAYWGEMLAEKINAKHIVYDLNENHPIFSTDDYQFLEFKLSRKELAGINPNTITNMFKNRELNDSEKLHLRAGVFGDGVENIKCKEIDNIKKADYNIGSIGRIDKLYYKTLIKSVSNLSEKYPNKSINLIILAGKHRQHDVKWIYDSLNKHDKIKLFIFGSMYPIPRKLFSITDVFVSTAGGASISHEENIPTITIDSNDLQGIGILGYTTNNTILRETETKQSVTKLLEDVLVKKLIEENILVRKYKSRFPNKEIEESFYDHHMEFINQSNKQKIYYNNFPIKLTPRELLKSSLISVLGINLYWIISRVRLDH